MYQQWLKGGPFFEVSFLIEHRDDLRASAQDIINKLEKVQQKIEIVDTNITEVIDTFVSGYPFDSEDPKSIYIHSMELNTIVHLPRDRKAILQIEKVSSNALIVDFLFFGSSFDAPEWNQIGIREDEIPDFTNFLIELFLVFEYKIGGTAVEENVLGLFSCSESYPNECYRYEKITPDFFLLEPRYFLEIIWNENYNKLKHFDHYSKKLQKNGILIKTGKYEGPY